MQKLDLKQPVLFGSELDSFQGQPVCHSLVNKVLSATEQRESLEKNIEAYSRKNLISINL